jgi:hypothetical protein
MDKKERFLLTESTQQFLLEVEGGQSLIEKAKADPNVPIYLTGIIQSGDKPNRNNRFYPWTILKKEAMRYLEEDVKHRQAYGELDHPEDSATPSLTKASHIIENIWFDENKKDIYARIKLLNAFAPANCPSLKARSIILNGGDIGISSRALGSLQEGKGYDIVEEDLEIVCWDLVSKASNYGSEKMNVTESEAKERSKNTLLLTESQCFGGNCNVGTKHNRIQEAKLHELNKEEKMYLNILGVEKFLQIKRKYNQFK